MAQPKALPELPDSVRDLADQHARVCAMLDRWASEDASDEPDWDVEQIDGMRFPPPPVVEPE